MGSIHVEYVGEFAPAEVDRTFRTKSVEIGAVLEEASLQPKLVVELRIAEVEDVFETSANDANPIRGQRVAISVLQQDGRKELRAQDAAVGQPGRILRVQIATVAGLEVEIRNVAATDAAPDEFLRRPPAFVG